MGRHVSLLAVGGTISTRDGASGAVPDRSATDLAAGLKAGSDLEVRPRDVAQISSRNTTPGDMWDLAVAVREEIRAGAAAVVVTHGTDTMEETAYALALLVDTTVPVVLTGAMRPPYTAGTDGPANLAAAVSAAATPALAAYGPVVVHQDEIHVATWVTKLYSTRVAAFASPAAGPVGLVSEGEVVLLLGPPPRPELLAVTAPPTRRVELLWAVAGADGLIVDAIAEKVDGLVVAGTGGGHTSAPLAESLVRLRASGKPVVLSSRCGGSQVLRGTYGGIGSEIHLLSEGLVSAGPLAPLKARLRLLFGLSAGLQAEDLFPTIEGVR
jgi:L-asparaginase